jgi:peroxiredoxin
LAISVDSKEESAQLKHQLGLPFPLLSDADEQVIERYGLVHVKGRLDGADISRPADLLLDANGIIRWATFTENWRVRARPEALLAAARDLQPPR